MPSHHLENSDESLKGLTIVITRPRAQGDITAQYLAAAGARVIRYPVLTIEPRSQIAIEKTFSRADLAHANGIIFVSANAVEYGLPVIRQYGELRADATLYAIGKMTAEALCLALPAGFTQKIETASPGNDSEALLAMPALQDVTGQHMFIVCGYSEAGGRTLLQQTLSARGAMVTLLTCYERKRLKVTADEQNALAAQLQSGDMTAFLTLSIETLDSLMENMSNMTGWQRCTLLVSHHRVAEAGRERGWTRCEIVPMNKPALVEALQLLKPTLRASF